MDEVRCIDPEAVAEVLELAPDHPRRAHAARCPRCRALLDGYQLFLAPPEPGPEHRIERADQRLDALRAELAGTTKPVPARAGETWWARLFQPALRPAWALATAAVVVAFAFVLPEMRARQPGSTLRGGGTLRGGTAQAPAIAPPEIAADGTVHLSWSPRADATGYDVVFYSRALREIGRHDAGTSTTLTLAPADLPAAYRAGEIVLYRVRALQDHDVTAVSEVGTLQHR